MTKEQRLEIEATLNKVFDGFEDERLKGKYYSMATMSEEEKKDLVRKRRKNNYLTKMFLKKTLFFLFSFQIDKHFLYTDDDETLLMVGTYDDWPAVSILMFCGSLFFYSKLRAITVTGFGSCTFVF